MNGKETRSGSVLLVALISLALMMLLLLALFQGSSHDIRGAQSEAITTQENILANSAVALVMDQIQKASTQTGQTWISQPGLLRTYDTTSSRKPTACYKLYSAAQMTDTTGTLQFLASDVPADWNSTANRSFYTDLNTPAQAPSLFSRQIYPILDPAAVTDVQGVSIDEGHEVEMPVAWLYQLQDGTIGPASNGTKANPIVARIAFWTDDDTCKVNVNTAGCGSGWSTPHFNSSDDVAWSKNQPANGEFSSYPGHPATTSLAAVFSSLSPQQLLGLTPRYPWGGSQFGTVATSPGQSIAPKTDRLYASLDELCFSSSLTTSDQRLTNPVTASQINTAHFVLTAISCAPETTMLGEPRVAIWPVYDNPQDSTHTTATDRAIESAATVGTRSYFFQRHDPLNALDDFDPASSAAPAVSNLKLFNDLVNRGSATLPGYGTAFSQKYTGANWPQLILEMTDFIRGLNSVDPSPAPFIPFAAGDATGLGRGFIVPLTLNYGSGASAATLRGFGRCPTLSSLTLVMYVSGFGFDDGTTIDFEGMDNTHATQIWQTYFLPGSTHWPHVTSELVRAFVVPCTFQPGCAYPEVSEACSIQITGLDGIQVSCGSASGNFGFTHVATSHLLSDALKVPPAERMWGGNEGPLAWRAAALDQMPGGSGQSYAFAGTQAFPLPMTTTTASLLDPKTAGQNWPPVNNLNFAGASGLTVQIINSAGTTLQTLSVNLPGFTAHAPTINGESDHDDASTTAVPPCFYMSLKNRLMETQASRGLMIQAGDISRSVEAATDLRVVAGLTNVPSTMFQQDPNYQSNTYNVQGGSPAHNLRFADGTSACFASGTCNLIPVSYPTSSTTIPVHDWITGSLLQADPLTNIVPYTILTQPVCNAPPNPPANVQMVSGLYGDWDTGPGMEPDGALINLPDEGTALAPSAAYFSLTGGQVGASTQRTPNALVPSPVIFGSLPTGINPVQPSQSQPWRTLLFCPYPAASNSTMPYAGHPGAATPPDYLILDNFWMPTVEPYAISGCMETAGKINLNDQIVPFTWLHRNTALRAVFSDLRIPAIAGKYANAYKTASATAIPSVWKQVDLDGTMAQIENRFANGSVDAYLSQSEICSVPLVPVITPTALNTSSVSAAQNALFGFWNGSSGGGHLTGDNLRELPYAQIYGRLATRSNSYTVHVRVQVLQKLPNDPQQNVWSENTDRILGDWRGSYEIERYLDPAATAPTAGQQLGPYKFRVVSSQRFAP